MISAIKDPHAPEVVAARARAVGEKVVLHCWPKAVRDLFFAVARSRRALDREQSRHRAACPACRAWVQDRSSCPMDDVLRAAWWRAHLLEEAYRLVLGLPTRLPESQNRLDDLGTWERLGSGR